MKKWLLVICTAFFVLGVGASFVYINWDKIRSSARAQERIEMARQASENGELRKALDLLVYNRPKELSGEDLENWVREEIKLSAKLRDILRMEILGRDHEDLILENEEAALLWARAYMHKRDFHGYERVRDLWKDKSEDTDLWFFLEVDRLMLEGRNEEALELLTSTTLGSEADAMRYVRLALFDAVTVQEAWNYLSMAYEIDPRNSDVRAFSGQLLEARGNLPAALAEYIAAYVVDTDNALMQRQLGDFFIRMGDIQSALNLWNRTDLDGEKTTLVDFIWIKDYFWSRVFNGRQRDIPPMAYSNMQSVETMLGKLPSKAYWSQSLANQYTDIRFYTQGYQELFWLKVLQMLQNGDEAQALETLRVNPFLNAPLQANITAALPLVIEFRESNTFAGPWPQNYVAAPLEHSFFKDIFALRGQTIAPQETLGKPFFEILYSPDAFSAVFLAAGWLDAAIEFYSGADTHNYPEWYPYGLTQAYRLTQGPAAALKFGTQQPESSTLNVLLGEIYIETQEPQKAIEYLSKNAQDDSPAGFRSAWLLSLVYLELLEPDQALQTVNNSPQLDDSILGAEIRARIAIAKGDLEAADAIYTGILELSSEAKVFHARKAFEEQRWEDARSLTEKLIQQFPNVQIFKENLKKIEAAEQGQL